eukprot:Pgem_evm1s5117
MFSVFYQSCILLCYVIDSFTLPLLKIGLRMRGVNGLSDVEFYGQDKLDDVDEVIYDSSNCKLLLDLACKRSNEELVLFLISIRNL